MRIVALAVFVAMVLFSVCSGSALCADSAYSKVGLINLQKVLSDSKAGTEARANFQKELASKRDILVAKEKAAKTLEDEIKSGGSKMTASVRRSKEEKLANDVKELRRLGQDMEEDLKKKDGELTSGILQGILDITEKVGKERGYSVIIQISPQVVYMDKSADITDEVLKRYDSRR